MFLLCLCQASLNVAQLAVAIEDMIDSEAVRVRQMLGDMCYLPAIREFQFASVSMQFAGYDSEQAGLTAAICTGDADFLAGMHLEVAGFEKDLFAPADTEFDGLKHVRNEQLVTGTVYYKADPGAMYRYTHTSIMCIRHSIGFTIGRNTIKQRGTGMIQQVIQGMIQQGQTAPAFSVADQDGRQVSSTDFTGSRNIVLYFYPKDDTPGCTIEANQFTTLIDEFAAADTVVLGVSKDDCASHQNFIDKFGIRFALLADVDGKLCQDYGVWQEKERDGVKKMGIVRSTFIIDKQGIVRRAEYAVSPDGHAQDVLAFVRQL